MNPGPNPAIVLSAQHHLRAQLLDRTSVVGWAPARNLTAHLLLSLEDPEACWRMSVEWLRDHFDVDRVEGGACDGGDGFYALGHAQARRKDAIVPSVRGIRVPLSSRVLRSLSNTSKPLVFEDIAQASALEDGLRSALVKVGTRVKIAAPLHFEGATFGFLCMDRVNRSNRLTGIQYERFQLVTGVVLGEILGVSRRIRMPVDDSNGSLESRLLSLTPAERKVLALLGNGLGYKQIAQQLSRSVHTIDHQLRSIRAKLHVGTNMQVIGLLSSAQTTRALTAPPTRHN